MAQLKRLPRLVRIAALATVALLPAFAKRWCYRSLFGYEIGPGVRIGLALLDARQHARQRDADRPPQCGHARGALRDGVPRAHRQPESHPGRRAGSARRLQRDHAAKRPKRHPGSRLHDGSASRCWSWGREPCDLGTSHRFHGSRHARQERHRRRPQLLALDPQPTGDGAHRDRRLLLPRQRGAAGAGAKLPDECILGIGAVLVGEIKEPRSLVAGVPAKAVRPLDEKDLARIRRKTRGDMPDDFYKRS